LGRDELSKVRRGGAYASNARVKVFFYEPKNLNEKIIVRETGAA